MGFFYSPYWPTRDHAIPAVLFEWFAQAMDNNLAAESLAESQTVALGIATALNGKDQKVKRFTRKLEKTGYPEVDMVVIDHGPES